MFTVHRTGPAPKDDDACPVGDPDCNTGSIYLFRYDGANWIWDDSATALDADPSDGFGTQVSMSGDRVVVGANGDDEAAPGAGAAYVFELTDALPPSFQSFSTSPGASDWVSLGVTIADDCNVDASSVEATVFHPDGTLLGVEPGSCSHAASSVSGPVPLVVENVSGVASG